MKGLDSPFGDNQFSLTFIGPNAPSIDERVKHAQCRQGVGGRRGETLGPGSQEGPAKCFVISFKLLLSGIMPMTAQRNLR